jgi:hypothetical protein
MDARRERLGPRVHKHIFSSAPKIKYKIVERPALKDRRDAVGQLSPWYLQFDYALVCNLAAKKPLC